ncbi:hypothetical protein RND81_05G206900 [Saponaria officinalis]|uniref:Pectinesterase inhibitor domain-containing protein n=1 Tax=Saponaria officinalis TaxID=3572 RepID=A0AAW1L2T8_SAPOF
MKTFSFPLFMTSMVTFYLATIILPFAGAHSRIEEACKKYNTVPSASNNGTHTCVSILSSIPGCDPSDPTTFALNGMEFAEQKVSETADIIKAKLKDRSLNPRVFGPLRTCMHLYNEGSYSFGFGVLAFKEQKYETVNYRWLNGAFYDVSQCERVLNMVGVKGEDLGIKTEYLLEVFNSAKVAFYYFVNNKLNVVA